MVKLTSASLLKCMFKAHELLTALNNYLIPVFSLAEVINSTALYFTANSCAYAFVTYVSSISSVLAATKNLTMFGFAFLSSSSTQ